MKRIFHKKNWAGTRMHFSPYCLSKYCEGHWKTRSVNTADYAMQIIWQLLERLQHNILNEKPRSINMMINEEKTNSMIADDRNAHADFCT